MTHEQKTQLWVAGIFLAVIILITVVATLVSSGGTTSPGSAGFTATQTSPVTSTDHSHGNASAKVTLIEYGDFECPACAEYQPIVQQLYTSYGDRVRFVFRNFPLYQIHPFAMVSGEAAEAANLQGKYWEMHDLLYANQSQWSTNTSLSPADVISKYFNGYAQSLGINVTQFDTDINSDAVKARVQSDLALGNAAQIDHTPTFFINDVQIPNPQSVTDFQKDLDAALASSTESTTSTGSTNSPQASSGQASSPSAQGSGGTQSPQTSTATFTAK